MPDDGPVIVFAGTLIEATLAKGRLEEAGIVAFLLDETMGTLAPWYVAPGGAGAVKVAVARPDLDRARRILHEPDEGGQSR